MDVDWRTQYQVSWTGEMHQEFQDRVEAKAPGLAQLYSEPGKAWRTGYDPRKLERLQSEGKLPRDYQPPTPHELGAEVRKINEVVTGRLQAAPEAFAIPLVPLLKSRRRKVSLEIQTLTEERDAYLLRYFLWAQLRRRQAFREVDLRLKLPTRGPYTIYSMWPETQEIVSASGGLRVDVGVNPSFNIQVPGVSLAPGITLGGDFRADAGGRFLVFKEWKRLRAIVQAKGIAGRTAEWLLDKPKGFVGNVEFLLVVLTPKGLEQLKLRVDGAYWLKDGLWRSPVEVKFQQRAQADLQVSVG